MEELAKGDWLVAHLVEALVQNHRLVDGVTPGLTAVLADDDDHDLIFVLAETLMED